MTFDVEERLDSVISRLMWYGIDRYAVIKGGYLLEKMFGMRGTRDVDMSATPIQAWGNIKEIFTRVGIDLLSSGQITQYKIDDPNTEKGTSGRAWYWYADGTKVNVDVSFQDLSYGVTQRILTLSINGGTQNVTANTYSIERVLSDKISAVWSKKQFRRTRDLFDIYYIIHGCSFSFCELTNCLQKAQFRFTPEFSPFRPEAYRMWEHAWSKFNVYPRGAVQTKLPPLQDALFSLSVFLQQYNTLLISRQYTANTVWDYTQQTWR